MKLLLSWPYFRGGLATEMVAELGRHVDLMVDCGAFTDRSKRMGNNEAKLAAYTRFARVVSTTAKHVIQLDRVGDHETSRANLVAMRESGLAPVPVVQTNAPLEYATELVDGGTPFLCVAGGVGNPVDYALGRYQSVYRATGERAQIHALGFTRLRKLTPDIGVVSCDASSWTYGHRTGSIHTHTALSGMRVQALPKALADPQSRKWLAKHNITMGMVKNGCRGESCENACMLSASIAVTAEAPRYERRGIAYWIAVSTWYHVGVLVASYRQRLETGTVDARKLLEVCREYLVDVDTTKRLQFIEEEAVAIRDLERQGAAV